MAKVKKVKEEISDVQETINPAEEKRNALIEGLKGKLLSKAQLKSGGPAVRSKHLREQGYVADIEEINSLGKQLGLAPIGLCDLRG